ncbi:MAG: AAA family ATPase [Cyanophyceae cyanobacterium]
MDGIISTEFLVNDSPSVPLVILMGIPGCGKSTIAHRWQQQEPGRMVVSTDSIRAQLFGDAAIQGSWAAIWQEVGAQWRRGINGIRTGTLRAVLYDATHANRRDRRRAIRAARQTGFTTVDGYWLNVPLEVCLARNARRSRQVPEPVVCRMHQQLQRNPPALSDGFDYLYTVGSDGADLGNLWRSPVD